MNVIFRDFSFYTRDAIAIRILPIWKFLNSTLPLYIWTCVYGIPLNILDNNGQPTCDPASFLAQQQQNQTRNEYQSGGMENLDFRFLEEDDECLNEIEGLALNAIELLATLVTKDTLYLLVKQAVYPIINAIAHFILLSKEQERLWIHEPNQFISNDEDEANMKSIRALAHNLIFQLIEKFGDQTTQALMIVAEKFMMNHDEAHTTQTIQGFYDKMSASDMKMGQQQEFTKEKLMEFVKTSNFDCNLLDHAWKKREVGLLLLGSFSDDIIDFQYKHTSTFDITSLIKNLLVDIETASQVPILIAKSLWCVSRFSEIIATKNTELFLPLFKVSASCLTNHQFPVRISAVKSIGIFSNKIKQYENQLPDKSTWSQYGIEDTSILAEIFDILSYANIETVHIILETLVYLNKLSKVYIPEIANLFSKSILQIFTLQHNDHLINRIIMELITQITEDPASFNIIFQTAFSSFILDSFNLIQHHVQDNSNLSQIKQQDLTFMANIFDVTSIFVKNCKESSGKESLIQLLPPLLSLMLVNEETSLQIHASICLKNFIKYADQYIIKNNLIKDVLDVIMKLLQIPENTALESCSTYAGNLCMLAFNNLLNGSADPNILKQSVYKILRSKLATTLQGLVLVWARMIMNDPLQSVNFLYSFSVDNRLALKILIDKWLLQQAVFRGKLTKSATLLALTKIFLLKDKRIENLIAIAFNPSHQNIGHDVSAPLKILSTLIRSLDTEMAPYRKDQQDLIKDAQNYMKGDDDERLEVDDDDNFDNLQDENEGKIEVGMNIIHDEEENNRPQRFAMGGENAGGLAEYEKNSTCAVTTFIQFGYDDFEECDETTEEDLEYLKDDYTSLNTVDILQNFFNDLAKNDPKYFAECLNLLLKEDVALLQKYINVKNMDTQNNKIIN